MAYFKKAFLHLTGSDPRGDDPPPSHLFQAQNDVKVWPRMRAAMPLRRAGRRASFVS
jgi:hypothetical protein